MGSLSIWHWLIVLAVVVLIFGTRKLRNAGGDLGAAVKNFKTSMREGEAQADADKTVSQRSEEKKPDSVRRGGLQRCSTSVFQNCSCVSSLRSWSWARSGCRRLPATSDAGPARRAPICAISPPSLSARPTPRS